MILCKTNCFLIFIIIIYSVSNNCNCKPLKEQENEKSDINRNTNPRTISTESIETDSKEITNIQKNNRDEVYKNIKEEENKNKTDQREKLGKSERELLKYSKNKRVEFDEPNKEVTRRDRIETEQKSNYEVDEPIEEMNEKDDIKIKTDLGEKKSVDTKSNKAHKNSSNAKLMVTDNQNEKLCKDMCMQCEGSENVFDIAEPSCFCKVVTVKAVKCLENKVSVDLPMKVIAFVETHPQSEEEKLVAQYLKEREQLSLNRKKRGCSKLRATADQSRSIGNGQLGQINTRRYETKKSGDNGDSNDEENGGGERDDHEGDFVGARKVSDPILENEWKKALRAENTSAERSQEDEVEGEENNGGEEEDEETTSEKHAAVKRNKVAESRKIYKYEPPESYKSLGSTRNEDKTKQTIDNQGTNGNMKNLGIGSKLRFGKSQEEIKNDKEILAKETSLQSKKTVVTEEDSENKNGKRGMSDIEKLKAKIDELIDKYKIGSARKAKNHEEENNDNTDAKSKTTFDDRETKRQKILASLREKYSKSSKDQDEIDEEVVTKNNKNLENRRPKEFINEFAKSGNLGESNSKMYKRKPIVSPFIDKENDAEKDELNMEKKTKTKKKYGILGRSNNVPEKSAKNVLTKSKPEKKDYTQKKNEIKPGDTNQEPSEPFISKIKALYAKTQKLDTPKSRTNEDIFEKKKPLLSLSKENIKDEKISKKLLPRASKKGNSKVTSSETNFDEDDGCDDQLPIVSKDVKSKYSGVNPDLIKAEKPKKSIFRKQKVATPEKSTNTEANEDCFEDGPLQQKTFYIQKEQELLEKNSDTERRNNEKSILGASETKDNMEFYNPTEVISESSINKKQRKIPESLKRSEERTQEFEPKADLPKKTTLKEYIAQRKAEKLGATQDQPESLKRSEGSMQEPEPKTDSPKRTTLKEYIEQKKAEKIGAAQDQPESLKKTGETITEPEPKTDSPKKTTLKEYIEQRKAEKLGATQSPFESLKKIEETIPEPKSKTDPPKKVALKEYLEQKKAERLESKKISLKEKEEETKRLSTIGGENDFQQSLPQYGRTSSEDTSKSADLPKNKKYNQMSSFDQINCPNCPGGVEYYSSPTKEPTLGQKSNVPNLKTKKYRNNVEKTEETKYLNCRCSVNEEALKSQYQTRSVDNNEMLGQPLNFQDISNTYDHLKTDLENNFKGASDKLSKGYNDLKTNIKHEYEEAAQKSFGENIKDISDSVSQKISDAHIKDAVANGFKDMTNKVKTGYEKVVNKGFDQKFKDLSGCLSDMGEKIKPEYHHLSDDTVLSQSNPSSAKNSDSTSQIIVPAEKMKNKFVQAKYLKPKSNSHISSDVPENSGNEHAPTSQNIN